MWLSPDQLTDIRHEVERQGGAPMPHECIGTSIKYKGARDKPRTQACGQESLFVLPYDVLRVTKQKGAVDRGGGFVTLCAYCDSMALMPRFEAVVREDYEA